MNGLTSMQKMWVSFFGIGFMLLASLLITFARYKLKKGVFRLIVSGLAFIILLYGLLCMIITIM
ncbi:MAG: DUF2768 domain-containing protein [Paenibacillaceae bacterium]|uniref:DUF2768 domain-containing protein n=1 Tax=Paenibacillus cymbidii TaxID=1639034 RepID=UPI00108002C6|nr:DUF2768 domain-containing protein [Paenibacillus cymbidii]MBO9607539.1 DUF2768 domain-containing protein [Paenibacillaceae bacterium]